MSALGVLIPPLRFSIISAVGPSQFSSKSANQEPRHDSDDEDEDDEEYLLKIARRRQAQQSQTLYRGTYPKPRNLPFLSRLYLKTILSLTPKPPAEIGFTPPSKTSGKDKGKNKQNAEDLSPATPAPPSEGDLRFKAWADSQGIKLIHIPIPSIKDRSPTSLPPEDAQKVLRILTDTSLRPLYMHCLDGVEITSLCTALFRKTQRWHPRAIMDEYARHLRDPTPSTAAATAVGDFAPTPLAGGFGSGMGLGGSGGVGGGGAGGLGAGSLGSQANSTTGMKAANAENEADGGSSGNTGAIRAYIDRFELERKAKDVEKKEEEKEGGEEEDDEEDEEEDEEDEEEEDDALEALDLEGY